MLKLKIKESVKKDIVVLTIPSRERQINNSLKCLSELDQGRYNIVLVCNTEKNEESEAFVRKIFKKYNTPSHQVVYNPEKTLSTGRNKGIARSIQNIDKGTRLTYIMDDDIVVYKPKEIFDFLEQGLQYTAFAGYPTFEISQLPATRRLAEANVLVDAIFKKEIVSRSLNFLEIEKPRRYTPFKGQKYENAYVLYGHVHGNLQLHFTKILEKVHKEYGGNNIFNPNRAWYGEFTELNYRLQRHGLIGGFLFRSPNKIEHLYKADKLGLVFHNDTSVEDSPTRTMSKRNENMLKSYIYLTIESDILPLDIPKEEFLTRFVDLLNSDFRFLKGSIQEFAKLLQLRYSTQEYLFGTRSMSNEQFERARKKLIQRILDDVYSNKEIKETLLRRKMEYETAPFKLAPFQQMTPKGFRESLRYQNELLKPFREDIYE